MPKIYDITLTITPELVTWPGDPGIALHRIHKIEDGANANVSELSLGVHTGTHVDAPYHFLSDGKTIETLALEDLIGPVQVVEIDADVPVLTAAVLKTCGIQPGMKRLLFKTFNSGFWLRGEQTFQTNFVGIPLDGAEYLVELGIRLVGIDYLSISPYKQSKPTHQALLRAGMVILEGADLSQVPAGIYQLVCLPMKLGGSDGAPARVVLISE
jgi:arylformamidase